MKPLTPESAESARFYWVSADSREPNLKEATQTRLGNVRGNFFCDRSNSLFDQNVKMSRPNLSELAVNSPRGALPQNRKIFDFLPQDGRPE